MAKHGPRHIREPVGVADTPDLLAGLGVVRRRAKGAHAQDLIASADFDHERRRIRLVSRLAPVGPPARLSRALVESDDVRGIAAVAAEDQQIAIDNWRSA